MNKGFLTIAQSGKHDYVKMAYVLAMSLKISQKKYNKLSVIVNKNESIPKKYLKVFDKIIYVDIPKEDWKVQNKWQYYRLSPYDETMVLDTDMLFFLDISIWWHCLKDTDIDFTSNVKNYKGENISCDHYRKPHIENSLPCLYTGLFYFKKSKKIKQFFNFVEIIFSNWKLFYNHILPSPPKYLSGDVVYSIAAKIFFNRNWNSVLTFTHMRGRLQDENLIEDWNKELTTYFTKYNNNIELKINNFNQLYPFHYIQKNFITKEVIELYEKTLCLL